MKANSIFLFLLSILPSVLNAQQLSIQEIRDFNEAALKTILAYEGNAYLQTNSERSRFKKLFVNEDLYIYNDLLGLEWSEQITVSQYVNKLSKEAQDSKFVLKNISKGDPYQKNEDWFIEVTFDKSIMYSNSCGVIYSSEEYYKADHKIKMILKWMPDSNSAVITSLSGKLNSNAPQLPYNYAVFERTSNYDDILLCNGKNLKFNKYGQTFIDSNSKFELKNDDIRLNIHKNDCNLYTINYHPMKYHIRPYFEFSTGQYYTMETMNGQILNSSKDWELGIDFGRVIFSRPKLKSVLFVGIGYSKSVMNLALPSLSYQLHAGPEADIDGESYLRYYDISDIKGTVNVHDLVAPLYFDIDTKLVRYVSLYFNLGVKLYTRLKTRDTQLSANYSTKGYYEQYKIMFDETSGINGFTNGSSFESSSTLTTTFKNKLFSLDGMGQVGLRFRLSQSIFMNAGITYQQSIIKPFNKDQSNTPSYTDESNPLLSYTIYGGEYGRGITDGIISSGRKNLKLSFGLTFKL